MKKMVLILIFLSSNSYANSLKECRAIGNKDERLNCYDQLADEQEGISQSRFGAIKYKDIPTEKIYSVIEAKKIHDRYLITMEDGQIWKQMERSRIFRIDAGNSVTIESGLLSSYFLSKEGSSVKIKVKRIK
ncbi:MAG: hypothetical protein CL693_09030 [Cellvibrionaceae bacterium]|mgnify:CR=1 FL=1|nr:hypothetical protein [Cellvibrionaceae bacterium]|tara:strand:- start:743 stop:1138 length:396 start_codon:yes stop_codon:yes gene_type:complete